MRNFYGRILVLIGTIAGFIVLLITIGAFIFYLFSNYDAIKLALTGSSMPRNYFGLIIYLISGIFYLYLLCWALKNIIKGRSMKHNFYGSIVALIIFVISICYLSFVPGIEIFNLSLFYSLNFASMILIGLLGLGSWANYKKDCR